MKFATVVAALTAGSAAAFAPSQTGKATTALQESKADLEALGKKLNPVVGFFDPLGLVESGPWGLSEEATIGWLRHSEIKHGRVAMFAFVGYCVQSSFTWPWALSLDGTPFPSSDLSPPEQWDALPLYAKMQIFAFIGFLEWFSELSPGEGSDVGSVHYTKGGQPGKFPDFNGAIPHSVPFNYFDPFKLSAGMSDEKKEARLRAEINNGRLAQLGIFGFLCEAKIPGSVPALSDIVKPYDGEVMGPFTADWSF